LRTTQDNTSVWQENAWQVGTPGRAGGGMPWVSLLGLQTGFVFPNIPTLLLDDLIAIA